MADIFKIIGDHVHGAVETHGPMVLSVLHNEANKAGNTIQNILDSEQAQAMMSTVQNEAGKAIATIHDIYNEKGVPLYAQGSEALAHAVHHAYETAIREGQAMGPAIQAAYDKASAVLNEVGGFTQEQPLFCTFVALGMVALLMPWAIRAFGFGPAGPRLGSAAAKWQGQYMGVVPAGSLFSFFQSLGMKPRL